MSKGDMAFSADFNITLMRLLGQEVVGYVYQTAMDSGILKRVWVGR